MKDKVERVVGASSFSFDPRSGRISFASRAGSVTGGRVALAFRSPDGRMHRVGLTADAAAKPAIDEQYLSDIHGKGILLRLGSEQAGGGAASGGLSLSFEVKLHEERPFFLFRLGVKNRGNAEVSLEAFTLFEVDTAAGGHFDLGHETGVRGPAPGPGGPGPAAEMAAPGFSGSGFFKAGWHDWVYSGFRGSTHRDVRTLLLKPWAGKMLFNPALPTGRGRGDFWSDGFGVLREGSAVLVTGLVTTKDQFGVVHGLTRGGRRASSLVAQADGVPLAAGESAWSEWGYLEIASLDGEDPLAGYVEAVAREMKPRVPSISPPVHWTSWYQYFENVTEELFNANIDVISRARDWVPYSVVQLDAGYQAAWGDWTTENEKFPSGLAGLSRRVLNSGFTPGLWLAPFVVDPRSRVAREHPDWLLKGADGKPVKSGFFYNFFGHALDPSHPAVLDHLRSTLSTIAKEWGFGFIKADFAYAGALPGKRHDPRLTRAQAFRHGMEAIREGIGESTFLLGCGCPFGPAIGIVDAMRIGPDTGPTWEPFLWNVPWATPLIRAERSVACLRNNMRHTMVMSSLHRRWWWNDPDCLMVRDFDTKLTDTEVRTGVTLIGLSGGLLIHSDDLTRLSAERRRLVSLLSPVLSPGGRALDLLQREMPEILDVGFGADAARRLAPALRWHAAAVFNWGDGPAAASLDPAQVGFQGGQALHIFDFWDNSYRLHPGGPIPLGTIPAHGCKLLRLCAAGTVPCLVADTLHITQGGEMYAWEVREERRLLFSLIDMGRKAEGEIFLALPAPPVRALCNGSPLVARQEAEGVYALRCSTGGASSFDVCW